MKWIRMSSFALLSLVMFSTINAQEKKNTAIVPNERKDKFAVARHENFVKRAKQGDVQVLFLGDSITQGWERDGKDTWKANFEALKAANFGISADKTQDVLWRITQGKELEGIHPKVCVLMIGTNNTRDNSATEIAEGIQAILKELHQQKPEMKVLLLGVFPRSGKRVGKEEKTISAKDLQPKIKEINDIIRKYDDEKKVFYLDIGEKFLEKDGGMSREVMPDYLHLSKKGYEIWAEAIKEKVTGLLK